MRQKKERRVSTLTIAQMSDYWFDIDDFIYKDNSVDSSGVCSLVFFVSQSVSQTNNLKEFHLTEVYDN